MNPDRDNSISGIVGGELPLLSRGYTSREVISSHGDFLIVKAQNRGKWFKLKALAESVRGDFQIFANLSFSSALRGLLLMSSEEINKNRDMELPIYWTFNWEQKIYSASLAHR